LGKGKREGREEGREGKWKEEFASLALGGIDAPGVLDFVLDLKSSDPSLENVYLSQSQNYVLNVTVRII